MIFQEFTVNEKLDLEKGTYTGTNITPTKLQLDRMKRRGDVPKDYVLPSQGGQPKKVTKKDIKKVTKKEVPPMDIMGAGTKNKDLDSPIKKSKVRATAANTKDFDKTLALQKSLIAKGAKIDADGIMGPKTRAAMKKFMTPPPVPKMRPKTLPKSGGPDPRFITGPELDMPKKREPFLAAPPEKKISPVDDFDPKFRKQPRTNVYRVNKDGTFTPDKSTFGKQPDRYKRITDPKSLSNLNKQTTLNKIRQDVKQKDSPGPLLKISRDNMSPTMKKRFGIESKSYTMENYIHTIDKIYQPIDEGKMKQAQIEIQDWADKFNKYRGTNADPLANGYFQAVLNTGIMSDAYEENEVEAFNKMKGYPADELDASWDDGDHEDFTENESGVSPITAAMFDGIGEILGKYNLENEDAREMYEGTNMENKQIEEIEEVEEVDEDEVQETVNVPVAALKELMALAGLTKVEEYANEPEPDYMDAEDQLVGLSGGLNGPKTMHPTVAGGDNPMAVRPIKVDEKIDEVSDAITKSYKTFLEEITETETDTK